MNLQPTIWGQQVQLRPLLATDFEDLYAVASDPLIWEQHPNPDRWQRAVFETFFEGALQTQGALLILEAHSGEVIGTSRYYGFDPVESKILIGYTFLGRNFWGKGINSEVKRWMAAHAFAGVDRIHFQIGAFNVRSQMAIERLGAKKIGEELVEYYGESPKLNFIYELTQNTFFHEKERVA